MPNNGWVTIYGVGDYYVGSNYVFDALQISSSGVLSNGAGRIGYTAAATNNSVLVTDTGSVWTNSSTLNVGLSGSSNSLVITNGGTVFGNGTYIGSNSTSSGNRGGVSGTDRR